MSLKDKGEEEREDKENFQTNLVLMKRRGKEEGFKRKTLRCWMIVRKFQPANGESSGHRCPLKRPPSCRNGSALVSLPSSVTDSEYPMGRMVLA